MTKKTVAKEEPVENPEIDQVKKDIGWLKNELSRLESLLPEKPDFKTWYSSPAVWLALVLVIAMLGMIAIFYITETGHAVKILNWTITRFGIR